MPKFRLTAKLAALTYRLARRLTGLEIAQMMRVDLASINSPRLPLDLEYRFLNADDVRAAATDPVHDLDAGMAEKLQSTRDFCFAAFDRGRLANYAWYALEAIEAKHSFGAGLRLPQDTVYMYKAYTVPAFRGRQIHGAALARAAEHFRQRGLAQMIAIVEFGNWPSLRSHAKLGFRPAGRLLCLGRKSIGWRCAELRREG